MPYPERPPASATPTAVTPPATARSNLEIRGLLNIPIESWPPFPSVYSTHVTVEVPVTPSNVAFTTAMATIPGLRSQAEFFMTGVLPDPSQPEVACSTCLEPLTDDMVKMVKRGHMFHFACVLQWFQSRSSRRGACPNCRTELFEPESLGTPCEPLPPV